MGIAHQRQQGKPQLQKRIRTTSIPLQPSYFSRPASPKAGSHINRARRLPPGSTRTHSSAALLQRASEGLHFTTALVATPRHSPAAHL